MQTNGSANLQNFAVPFSTNSAEFLPLDDVISSDSDFVAEAQHEARQVGDFCPLCAVFIQEQLLVLMPLVQVRQYSG